MMMTMIRREFLQRFVARSGMTLGAPLVLGVCASPKALAARYLQQADDNVERGDGSSGPDPLFEKPEPITMASLAQPPIKDVVAVEVNDYLPGGFAGDMTPSPPHADLNPKKAVVIAWKDRTHQVVFCHETSYDPYMELPNGVALCNQFFEGNRGWAELFNNNGRKERNSFVDIIQSGPERVWVRWNYFCVNKDDDSHPALRGTEDYIAYPNGLMWRRLTYTTMMPGKPEGYSWDPIDYFAMAPNGTTWKDLFPQDAQHGDYHVGTVLDAYSDKRYDKYWDDNGNPRRIGDAELLLEISGSRGFAIVLPLKAGLLFTILGASSGFPSDKSQVVDHSFKDTGGWGWGARRWDHWPIGWENAQEHEYVPGSSAYPYHFAPFSHYIVNTPLKDSGNDYEKEVSDTDLNRWSERHVYYTLTGVAADMESIRRLARQWLDRGPACASAASIANLRWPSASST